MTWFEAHNEFLTKIQTLDVMMIAWKGKFAVVDRLIHQAKCQEIGYDEALKEGVG